MTMYDMTRVNANGYFDNENTPEARFAKKLAMNTQRTEDYKMAVMPLQAVSSILCRTMPHSL